MQKIYFIILSLLSGLYIEAQSPSSNVAAPQSTPVQKPHARQHWWNFHAQNTDVVQGDPGFRAWYSGFNSLSDHAQVQETVTVDAYAGVRLWPGAEIHADFLMWQGFGLSQTFGIEDFPNGDAYKAGTTIPNASFAHLFIRQTIGLGGEKEDVPDDELTLAGKQAISRLTFTIGRMSPMDICDNNTYAHDEHTQFLNWAAMGNITWDYGENTIGYTTGLTIELNQRKWALRYGFFQMPDVKNGFTGDDEVLMYPMRGAYGPFLKSWGMMLELEGRYSINTRAGTIRFMPWLDEDNFASYQQATALLLANPPSADVGQGSGITIPSAARAYRLKPGLALNWEQEVASNTGLFLRVGWTPGKLDTWTFADPDWSASVGVSVKGVAWHRPGDTYGFFGVVSGASLANQKFLEAGGTDMLDGDGNLNYSPEAVIETYYDFQIWNCKKATRNNHNLINSTINLMLDYQFVANPAFNSARGPVNIFAARFHWDFGVYK